MSRCLLSFALSLASCPVSACFRRWRRSSLPPRGAWRNRSPGIAIARRGLPQLCAAPLPPRHHRGRGRHPKKENPKISARRRGRRSHHHPAAPQVIRTTPTRGVRGNHKHDKKIRKGCYYERRALLLLCYHFRLGRQTPRAYAGQPLHRPRPRTPRPARRRRGVRAILPRVWTTPTQPHQLASEKGFVMPGWVYWAADPNRYPAPASE